MIDEICCACVSDEECPHDCGLTADEIAANTRRSDELMETYFSLKPGEKKQVPSTGQWVTFTLDGRRRFYGFCDPPE